MIREYELLYIIPTTVTDDEVSQVETRVTSTLQKFGGSVVSATRLGKLRLAYPIKGVRHGHFVQVRFQSESGMVLDMDKVLRIDAQILRHLILRADEVGPDKFDLVQFAEVVVESARDSRDDRRRTTPEKAKPVVEESKEAVVAPVVESAEKAAEVAPAISAEELDKKIDAVLEEKA